MKKIIILLFCIASATLIHARNEADMDKNPSNKKIRNVVILGNSIVSHPPAPEIGWDRDWGMAASARDSDFIHLLIRDIHKIDESVNICYASISRFEFGFDTYDLDQLEEYKNPDMLILKISENVDPQKAIEKNFNFHYDKLVKYLAPIDSTITIIVDGFWPSPVNDIIKKYAIKNDYPFVTLPDLFQNDKTNSAIGLIEHEGVASHPSDKGMRNIALRIWNCISIYFTEN
jgi:hypothetical protein